MASRRQFLLQSATLAAGAASISSAALAVGNAALPRGETTSLCGAWFFRIDAEDSGTKQEWFRTGNGDWHNLNVPHTWQVEPAWADYHGPAWYRRTFDCPQDWAGAAARIEFEAVFHSATVWVNGQLAGEHLRKGYTAFALDISRLLRLGQPNAVVVRVDNSFDEHMLPRGRSSDWAHDGGIFRPVQLIVTPASLSSPVDVRASQSGKVSVFLEDYMVEGSMRRSNSPTIQPSPRSRMTARSVSIRFARSSYPSGRFCRRSITAGRLLPVRSGRIS